MIKFDLSQVLFILMTITLGLVALGVSGCAGDPEFVSYSQAPYHHYTKDVDHCCRY